MIGNSSINQISINPVDSDAIYSINDCFIEDDSMYSSAYSDDKYVIYKLNPILDEDYEILLYIKPNCTSIVDSVRVNLSTTSLNSNNVSVVFTINSAIILKGNQTMHSIDIDNDKSYKLSFMVRNIDTLSSSVVIYLNDIEVYTIFEIGERDIYQYLSVEAVNNYAVFDLYSSINYDQDVDIPQSPDADDDDSNDNNNTDEDPIDTDEDPINTDEEPIDTDEEPIDEETQSIEDDEDISDINDDISDSVDNDIDNNNSEPEIIEQDNINQGDRLNDNQQGNTNLNNNNQAINNDESMLSQSTDNTMNMILGIFAGSVLLAIMWIAHRKKTID